ncbi:MAG: tRNA (N(6)-L-threonylcarbamoyladenosine(37)-C(2))-methylthiotransferase MtaB [Candidatus Omnitrophota bacterium]
MQTIKFYTLGCKVNQYETQLMRERILLSGIREEKGVNTADFCVINTCTVTHRADADSLSSIYRAKRQNPEAKIIVTGCLAEADAQRISGLGNIDLIVRNKDKQIIDTYLNSFRRSGRERKTGQDKENKRGGISYFAGHTRAFIKVQDGCDNLCSYCKVRLVRGKSKSRDWSHIIEEARRLVESGVKEIVLCGICLGSYGRDLSARLNLTQLISRLEDINGLLRIRLSSIEAKDVSGALIKKMASSLKLCPHLHIPIQSGDNKILRLMKRGITREGYLRIFDKVRRHIPGIAITTDVMVGFPQEAEENFLNTFRLIKEVSPLRVHIFGYSPRKGTVASRLYGAISPKVIGVRMERLKELAESCSIKYRSRFLNKEIAVLIEGRYKETGHWQGYTGNYMKIVVKSRQALGNQLIHRKPYRVFKDYMEAEI